MTCQSGICRCGSFQFHNISTLACTSQNSHNQACIVDFNCRVDKGLECRNNLCECVNATPTWISNAGWVKCIKLKNYTETCTSSIECDGSVGLVCNSGSNNNLCNCPSTSSVGMCDCVRRSSNETYWNGTKCIAAAPYGQSCIANTNYTCQTITEKTMCNSSGICSCGTNGGLDSGQCISCNNDWKYINKKCYRIGISSGQSDTNGQPGGLSTACPNGNSVNLAQLSSTEVVDYFNGIATAGSLYWVDLHQASCSSSTRYQSCSNCGNNCWREDHSGGSSRWCPSGVQYDDCVYYDFSGNCYQDTSCGDTNRYFCQYDAQ